MRRNIKVAISFDDCVIPHHYQIAYELFKLKIPATFYIITHKHPWSMCLKYAKKIVDMKHEVGSHGAYHIDLIRASDDKLLFEVEESKRVLEEVIGQEVAGFAYPYGPYNSKVISIASRFYKYGRTIYLRTIKTCNSANVAKNNRYAICGLCNLSPRPMLEILRDTLNKSNNELKITWVFHFEPLWEILMTIKLFKSLGATFIHVEDIADELPHTESF
jgi:peptidoglycan/xylan/chitin deacetylase (PgdA/CDA1 family)